MDYQVRFIRESDLPAGVDYVFARTADHTYLFLKQPLVAGVAGEACDVLTRSFNTWERAQSVELKEFADAS